jgi:isoquinoline 1-oxidoreductase beta subunit
VPGVVDVQVIDSGVAVLGRTTWAALAGRAALEVSWDESPHAKLDDAAVRKALETRLASGARTEVTERGDAAAALSAAQAGSVMERTYFAPYLAHAPLEPINCTAHVQADRCELWVPTQSADGRQADAVRILGLPESQVIVHSTLVGGGFGRRFGQPEAIEAIELSRRAKVPVQVVWTREDDLRHDAYRPASLHALRATLDADGGLHAYEHVIASPSIVGVRSEDELDGTSAQGASPPPYACERMSVQWVSVELPIPVGFWRSVGHSFNAFAMECFVDELATERKIDPLALRRTLLKDSPRDLGVLERAAKEAGWDAPPQDGRGRGIAVHPCFGSHCATVAEVALGAEGQVRVERLVIAADCGIVVHPDNVRAQLEGAAVFGLSAALFGRIEIAQGAVVQSNYHDYPILRFDQTPVIETHLVGSAEPPGGVGELGVPCIAPAVCNALFALTGRRVRELPIAKST